MKVLLIEDDKVFADLIGRFLERAGFKVMVENSVKEVIEEERYLDCSVVILDLMFNSGHGMDLVRVMNELKLDVPLIVMSGVNDLESKVVLLNSGADDYITKPVNPEELLARLQAVLRRFANRKVPEVSEIGEMRFCYSDGSLFVGAERVELRDKELILMRCLVKNLGKRVKSEELFEQIWEGEVFSSVKLVSLVKRLRRRFGESKGLLKTVYGIGYRLDC